MKAVVQRVNNASVNISLENYSAKIGRGMLILLGIKIGDTIITSGLEQNIPARAMVAMVRLAAVKRRRDRAATQQVSTENRGCRRLRDCDWASIHVGVT